MMRARERLSEGDGREDMYDMEETPNGERRMRSHARTEYYAPLTAGVFAHVQK